MLRRVQIGRVHHGSNVLRVRQRLQRLVPYVDGVLNGPLPIRILIDNSRQDLREVITVGVSDERSQDLRASVCLDAVLHVLAVERKVRFRSYNSKEQVVPRELGDHGLSEEDVIEDVDGGLRLGALRLAVGIEFVVVRIL